MPRARSNGEPGGTNSVVGARAVLEYAKTRGVDTDAVMAAVGLDPRALADPDGRIPLRVLRQVWEHATARSNDPAFGLHLASRTPLGAFEALDYALWSSATLRDVFERVARFYRVLGDDLGIYLAANGRWVRVHRVVVHDLRQRVEGILGLLTVRCRELVGRAFRLHEVRFVHRAPPDVRPHRALFRCPVRFGCSESALVFEPKMLALPVKSAKPGLAEVLDRHLRDQLARLPKRDSFYGRVHQAIARELHRGRPSIAATAEAVHASPRTLQRYLHDMGITYRQVVDDVRRDMAERLLATRRLSIGEITFLLGFEDVSGFRRAYRRWTGTNPSRARSRQCWRVWPGFLARLSRRIRVNCRTSGKCS